MEKRKIAVINIRNSINKEKEPVGHAVKYMYQTIELVKSTYLIQVISSKKLTKFFMDYNCKILPFSQRYSFRPNKFLNFIKDFINTIIAIMKTPCIIDWFILMSEPAFWAIALMPKQSRKYVVTLYMDFTSYFDNVNTLKKLRCYIFQKACMKIDLAVITNKQFQIPSKSLFVPDYYVTDIHKELAKKKKEKKIVCVGQMRESRDLDGVINTFANSNFRVEIIGEFSDKNWYKRLSEKTTSNIFIKDKILTDEAYYNKLAEAQFSILPYDMKIYHARTSGVLLETVFLGVIPIAPKELLEYNGIHGIGYNHISEVPFLIENTEIREKMYNADDYEMTKIKENLIEILKFI